MNQNSILNWLFHYMLEHEFHGNRRDMALNLRVTETTLTHAMEDEETAETALLFEQLLAYTLEHDLCIDKILLKYKQAR